jgi:SAM-dependent methyltransferase
MNLSPSRLTEQYVYTKKVFDHTELLPPTIDLGRVHRVLDVAAGTGVWAFDLTDVPAVRPRLAPDATNPLEIYICDITTSNFPPSELLRSVGIRAFQQDVTESFTKALYGTFDIVHMACLGLSLNDGQWKLALKNVRDVLSVF